MTKYRVDTPVWLKFFFPKGLLWKMPPTEEPTVYLTFDDGPHPTITPFIMEQLQEYGGKATFFCIGKNVEQYPYVFNQLKDNGHRVANHTQNHMNGWNTSDTDYVDNIITAATHIQSTLFRPPYGRIRKGQVREIKRLYPDWNICMWSLLSGDFDTRITPQKCLDNVLRHIKPGALVVFHDSDKAWDRLSYALPQVLAHCKKQGWKVAAIPN